MVEIKEILNSEDDISPETFKRQNYRWYRDEKILGTVLLIIMVAMQIFAFLKVPFFYTFHAYTIGMLFGWYSPFFYVFMIYVALLIIFADKVKLPKWVKLTPLTYWIAVFCSMFIIVSTGYYQSKNDWTNIGGKAWSAMDYWFNKYKGESWVFPANTNGGLIGALLYSFFSMIASGIGSFILAIILLALNISFILSGSAWGFYRELINKKMTKSGKELESTKNKNGSNLVDDLVSKEISNTKNLHSASPVQENISKTPTKIEEDLPFEDPF